MCFFGESLYEEPGFDVPSCIAGGFDMRLHPADGEWNAEFCGTEAGASCHRLCASSTLAEADAVSSSESRERSGGWWFENALSDRLWTAT